MWIEKLFFCWHFECVSFAFSSSKQQRGEKKSHRRNEEFEEWKIDSCEHEFSTHEKPSSSGRASNLMWACHAFRDSHTASRKRHEWVRKHVEIPFDVNWFWTAINEEGKKSTMNYYHYDEFNSKCEVVKYLKNTIGKMECDMKSSFCWWLYSAMNIKLKYVVTI